MNTLDLFFSTVRTVFDALRLEQSGSETPIETLSRLTREAASWRALGTSKPEPAPQNESGPAVWPIVIAHMQEQSDPVFALMAKDAAARHEFGLAKYGVALAVNNGRSHHKDAYQEALDLVVYLRAHYEQTGYGYGFYLKALDFAAELRRELEDA